MTLSNKMCNLFFVKYSKKKCTFTSTITQGQSCIIVSGTVIQHEKEDPLWLIMQQGSIRANSHTKWERILTKADLWPLKQQPVSGRSEAKGRDGGQAPFDIFLRALRSRVFNQGLTWTVHENLSSDNSNSSRGSWKVITLIFRASQS